MIDDVQRKQILHSFIENIFCMSDKSYQERVWVHAEGPECDDIDDTICDFFDEDYILDNYKDFGITETQYKLLIKLRTRLREFADIHAVYSSQKSTEYLISLSQWEEIREISKNILQSFNFMGKNNEFG